MIEELLKRPTFIINQKHLFRFFFINLKKNALNEADTIIPNVNDNTPINVINKTEPKNQFRQDKDSDKQLDIKGNRYIVNAKATTIGIRLIMHNLMYNPKERLNPLIYKNIGFQIWIITTVDNIGPISTPGNPQK